MNKRTNLLRKLDLLSDSVKELDSKRGVFLPKKPKGVSDWVYGEMKEAIKVAEKEIKREGIDVGEVETHILQANKSIKVGDVEDDIGCCAGYFKEFKEGSKFFYLYIQAP